MTQGGWHNCPKRKPVNSKNVNTTVNKTPVNTAPVNIRPPDAHSLLIARLASCGVSLLDLEALARGEKKLVSVKPKTDRKEYIRNKMREHRKKLKADSNAVQL